MLVPVSARAQKINTSGILTRLRASLQQMTNALPSLVCHEEVVSAETVHGKVKTTGNFGYQLTVTRPAKLGNDFSEERKLLTYDGRPVRRNEKHTPIFILSNGFGDTFDGVLSPDASRCLLYSAHATTEDRIKALEIDIRKNRQALALPVCRAYENDPDTTASFWISADSGQLLRFYLHQPRAILTRHRRVFGFHANVQQISNMTIETDYRSVQFGPALTIIPAKVNVTAIMLKKPYGEYTYHSVQNECQRFLVTVTQLPGKVVPSEN